MTTTALTRSPTTQRTITLPSGITLSYATRGPEDHEPIVFLHGWPDSWRSFQWVMDALPSTTSALAVSLRGFGGSDRPDEGYTPGHLAADVVELIDTLGLRPALLVGHSMGSVIVQHIAVDRPDLVSGIVLIGGFTRVEPALADEVGAVLAGMSDVDEAFVREFQRSTLAQPIDPDRFDQIIAESTKAPARVWRATFDGLGDLPGSAPLTSVTAPTLLLWGDRDALIPRSEQDVLCAAIAGARLEVYEGAGHSPNWEDPERVAADIVAFDRQLAARWVVR